MQFSRRWLTHNMNQIRNNVLWDKRYFCRIFLTFILSMRNIQQNIVIAMDLNKVMGMCVLVRLLFMFSNIYLLDLHNEMCVALANLQWSITKNQTGDWTSQYLVMLIKSAYLLISCWNPMWVLLAVFIVLYWVWNSWWNLST